jgi:hypothetical protein
VEVRARSELADPTALHRQSVDALDKQSHGTAGRVGMMELWVMHIG